MLRNKSFLRAFACVIGAVSLALVLGYLFRSPLLTGLARAWVVDERLMKADAIVVLGGHPDVRGPAAARLYHAGLAPRILYMDVRLSPMAEMHITPSEKEITSWILRSNSVPETAIEAIGNGVSNTYDESQAVRAWLEKNGAHSIIIATDLFHTRRVSRLFHKQLKNTGAELRVSAVNLPSYETGNWWRNEEGLIAFQNEVMKSLYYQFRY